MIACIIIISSSSIPQLSTSTLILPSDDVSIEIISPIDLSTITQETIKKNQSPSIIDKSLTIKFQVPTIAFNHQVHVLVGSYDPIIFQHPCINIPGCLYNSKENMIQITIQTIEVGTYTLKVMAFYDHNNLYNKERKSSILENIKSKEIIFDIIPAALKLENSLLPVKENYYEDEYEIQRRIQSSPGFLSICQENHHHHQQQQQQEQQRNLMSTMKIAIVSSFAHGLNGQIIMLTKLVEEMKKKKNIEIKWVTADENSPDGDDINDNNLLRLKHWNIKYVKTIMKVPNELYEYANKSIETLVKIAYELYNYEQMIENIHQYQSKQQLSQPPPPSPPHLFKYKKLVYKMLSPVIKEVQNYDIVHFTTREMRRWEDQLFVIALRFANVKVIIAEPGSIETNLVNYVDAYIVPSQVAKRHMKQIRPDIPTFVLKPYVDKTLYERYWPIRQKMYNFKEKTDMTIAFLGRLASVKSPGIFLKVVKIIIDQWKKVQLNQQRNNVTPTLKFKIIGTGTMEQALKMACERLGIEVVFRSKLHEDLPSYLSQNVDIVAHTTLLNESFGLSNLEAMAAEVAVVTFGVGGVNEYLSLNGGNHRRGLIVSNPSAESMAFTILSLITNNRFRHAVSVAGREYVFKQHSPYHIDNMVRRYHHILSGLLCFAKTHRQHTNVNRHSVDHPDDDDDDHKTKLNKNFVCTTETCLSDDIETDTSKLFNVLGDWYVKERGYPYNDGNDDGFKYLTLRNETFFQKAIDFYKFEWKNITETYKDTSIPHPVLQGIELSPTKWLRRGNFYMTAPHKLRHDIEQLLYLIDLKRLPKVPFQDLVTRYENVLQIILKDLKEARSINNNENQLKTKTIDITNYILKREQIQHMYATHNTLLYLYKGTFGSNNNEDNNIIIGKSSWQQRRNNKYLNLIINPYLDFYNLEMKFKDQYQPGYIVVDDFLTNDALNFLYNYCLESTIWHAVKHGYVGAHHDDGFMHPVVNQLVEELYLKFPQLIGGLELLNLWAYKSEQMYDGVPVHADQATVSFNLWITPDEANLNNENGGLLIYPKEAIKPKDWSFVDANGLDSIGRIKSHLKRFQPAKIPYKVNRMIILRSALFHKTDTFQFKKGYKNRRINLTIMFGKRE